MLYIMRAVGVCINFLPFGVIGIGGISCFHFSGSNIYQAPNLGEGAGRAVMAWGTGTFFSEGKGILITGHTYAMRKRWMAGRYLCAWCVILFFYL